ncbi:hypothetical protein Adi01nite_75350 [Amorphoplanes digitatis]|nr:hypothetical protein GCM10020092_016680 [Actinoplanes digitatis]GID98123.1 hypothetical protein Adi01nite_75350 [Actinoplanes digitatis]
MGNSGEYPFDDASRLIHAGDHDYHLRLDGAQCLGRHGPATSRKTGLARILLGARVKLDHPLQLMNPDRAEALTPERISQSHTRNVPPTVGPAASEQFTFL